MACQALCDTRSPLLSDHQADLFPAANILAYFLPWWKRALPSHPRLISLAALLVSIPRHSFTCECPKCHGIVCFKMVTSMLCQSCLNKKESKIKTFSDIRAEIICCQQKTCTLRNVKDSSPQGRVIPNGNLDLHEGKMSPRNRKYVGKYNFSHLKISLNISKLFKAKILTT